MDLLPESYLLFCSNLDETRQHIEHALRNAPYHRIIAALDLHLAIDALQRARKRLFSDDPTNPLS